jgi:hypothetical protein
VAPDEPGGTRACRGSDRAAPGRRGQARGQIEHGAAQGNNARADKLQKELEGRQALLEQALKGLQEFGG